MEMKHKGRSEAVWQSCLKRNNVMKENSYVKSNTYHVIASVCQDISAFKKKSVLGKVDIKLELVLLLTGQNHRPDPHHPLTLKP